MPWWNSSRAVLLTFGHLGLQSWWKVIAVEISCFRVSLVTGGELAQLAKQEGPEVVLRGGIKMGNIAMAGISIRLSSISPSKEAGI